MKRFSAVERLVWALVLSSGTSIVFLVIRKLYYQSDRYLFLAWNLVLAWLPLFFAWQLFKWLNPLAGGKPWVSWQGIGLTLLWLVFLPNSFYLSSDLIHLRTASASTILYDVVLLLSFALNGLVLGFMSVFFVHRQLLKRLRPRNAHIIVAAVLLLGSFAIYLGRYLRWNTWDVLANPASLLFDVSNRLINPGDHPQTFATTATFFVLFGTMYFVIWQFITVLRTLKDD